VLLLDELTTFLDYEDQENVLQCVRKIVDDSRQQLQQQQTAAAEAAGSSSSGGGGSGGGVTALWVTHRLEELDYADSVRWGQPLAGSSAGEPGLDLLGGARLLCLLAHVHITCCAANA
jgi:hypothetical protein